MLVLTRIGWAQAQEVFVGRRRRLGRRNFRSRACVYLTTPEGVRCLTTCARVSFFHSISRRKENGELLGGLQCPSGYLFIYLNTGEESAQTQEEQQGKKGSSSFYI